VKKALDRVETYVNFHLRSQQFDVDEMEAMVGVAPLRRFVPGEHLRNLPSRANGLMFTSPLSHDSSSTPEEMLAALLDLLEPHKDVIARIGDTHGLALPPNFVIMHFKTRGHTFVLGMSRELQARVLAFGFALWIEVHDAG
jgi:hypothetical protein